MNVIFLDFDGVLNCETRWKHGCVQVDASSSSMLDPVAVKLLSDFAEAHDARIVISSTWRRFYDLDVLRDFLASLGLTAERVIDVTPYLLRRLDVGHEDGCPGLTQCTCKRRMSEPSVPRGHEILAWLREHPDVTNFVIFDDDRDMDGVESHHIKTTWKHGLLPEHIARASDLFGGKAPVRVESAVD